MIMGNILAKLEDSEINAFKQLIKQRDEAAFKVGVAALELQRITNKMNSLIDHSIHEEKQLAERLMKKYSIDKNLNTRIDYEAGIIAEIKQ